MKELKLRDFDFELPKELIAQNPLKNRSDSRLMVLDKKNQKIIHEKFKNIAKYFKKGDVLVRNNTKVIPARLFGYKETGAEIELLLNKRIENEDNKTIFEVLINPSAKIKEGHRLIFKEGVLEAKVLKRLEATFLVEFAYKGIFEEVLNQLGKVPLPKYIKNELDKIDRYQTIYAKEGQSSAAPTAGLHFTEEIFEELKEKGVEILDLNLEIGLGTFAPVWYEDLEKHKMHSEKFFIPQETAQKINQARREKRRIIALGTTSVRALESAVDKKGDLRDGFFETDIFIKPGYQFKIVDVLITNFHLPKSTLLMLVSALAGREFILRAYQEAVKEKYRFFSFGDAMMILDESK